MGFSIEQELETDKYTLVKVVFHESFTGEEFSKFLGVLSLMLDISDKTGKPFAFYVDASKTNIAPIHTAKKLITWKRKEAERIRTKRKLVCSAVYIKNVLLKDMITTALKISPPQSPNVVAVDIDIARNFVLDLLNKL